MLSVESQTVYDIISAIVGASDVYKVVDADEITEKLPPSIILNKVQLSQIIRDLKERELVGVKYFTPDEYCLNIIKRIDEPAKPAQPQQAAVEEEQAPQERVLYGPKAGEAKPLKKGTMFIISVLGGLISSGIVAAIALVIAKFVL